MSDLVLKIDTNKIKNNIELLRKNKNVIAMVKANSYGVSIDVVEYLKKFNVQIYGVTSIFEADRLREKYSDIEILIFTKVDQNQYQKCISNNYQLVVSSIDELHFVDDRIKVHVKFDTGMGRLGIDPINVAHVKDIIHSKDNVVGILSHLAFASNIEQTNKQIKIFKEVVKEINCDFKYIHLQNTLGSCNYDIDICNTVRIGIGMYGLFASKEESDLSNVKLKNALTLDAKVILDKNYEGLIGYDLTEEVSGNIKTIRIGYADGLRRSLQGFKFTNGSKIVGRISMCQTTILCENEFNYQEIFGNNESIYDLCEYANIITYELLVCLGERITRKFI